MSDFEAVYNERVAEINDYLSFLEGIENAVRTGSPKIGGPNGPTISTRQIKILYSSVYLQLYNLVESTVQGCVDEVGEALILFQASPETMSEQMLTEWVKVIASTNDSMAAEKRLQRVLELLEWCSPAKPVSPFTVLKGGGGNWDHIAIKKMIVDRLGLKWGISKETQAKVMVDWRDERGALESVKKFRNDLAHGSISFVDCAQSVTASDLRGLADIIMAYFCELIESVKKSIQEHEFLRPNLRPAGVVV